MAATTSTCKWGNPVSVHGHAPPWKSAFLWIGLFFVVMGIGLFFVPSKGGPGIWSIIGPLLFLAFGAFLASFPFLKKGHNIQLFQNGVRVSRDERALFETIWSDVNEVHEQIEGGEFCGLTVFKSDGTNYRFYEGWIVDFVPLRDKMHKAIQAVVAPRITGAFKRGEPFDFGGLQISPKGVHHDGRILPWTEIEIAFDSIHMIARKRQDAAFVLRHETYWKRPTVTVPNFTLLMRLLQGYQVAIKE